MNLIKLMLGIVILGSTILVGCASTNKIEHLSTDIENLNTKTDQINNDINAIRSDMQTTKDEAVRANQRLDNQIQDYKK